MLALGTQELKHVGTCSQEKADLLGCLGFWLLLPRVMSHHSFVPLLVCSSIYSFTHPFLRCPLPARPRVPRHLVLRN